MVRVVEPVPPPALVPPPLLLPPPQAAIPNDSAASRQPETARFRTRNVSPPQGIDSRSERESKPGYGRGAMVTLPHHKVETGPDHRRSGATQPERCGSLAQMGPAEWPASSAARAVAGQRA